MRYHKHMKSNLSQRQFRVVIERDEDGYFIASVPALPGCHTQAKTFAELRTHIQDAIRLCLAVAKNDPKYRARIKQFAYEPSFVGMELIHV